MDKKEMERLINIDMPADSPVTSKTIANCVWHGVFSNRRPIPQDLLNKIKPNMSREKIIEVIRAYSKKGRR